VAEPDRLTPELDVQGLPKKSWVKISQIRTLSVERIGRRLGGVSPEVLDQMIEALKEIIR
jgi:mRNA interferase MazF